MNEECDLNCESPPLKSLDADTNSSVASSIAELLRKTPSPLQTVNTTTFAGGGACSGMMSAACEMAPSTPSSVPPCTDIPVCVPSTSSGYTNGMGGAPDSGGLKSGSSPRVPSVSISRISSVSCPKTDPNAEPFICFGCHKKILDRYLLRALNHYWHEDCLKCACCDCRLGEVGSSLYTKDNHMILCKRDYLRLFGVEGQCAACNNRIPAFEMVMRARNNVYHLECFACQECGHRFCVGDRFYLCDNKILCEYDYEERMVFANLGTMNYPGLAQLKRQIQQVDDLDEVQQYANAR